MMKDYKKFEEKLLKTQKDLEAELKNLGEAPEMGSDVDAFDTETDETEEFGNNLSVKQVLKERLKAVKSALERIKKGAYGICQECGKEIPDKVLEVNPEGTNCMHCKE